MCILILLLSFYIHFIYVVSAFVFAFFFLFVKFSVPYMTNLCAFENFTKKSMSVQKRESRMCKGNPEINEARERKNENTHKIK